MKIKLPVPGVSLLASSIATLSTLFIISEHANADGQVGTISPDLPTSSSDSSPDTRYGLFNLLDHRSTYGQGGFPEPFLVDDSDLEVNEFRIDWLHTSANNQHTNLATVELEKGFGLLTLEVEVPFEKTVSGGQTMQGFDNVSLGARYPFYQFVSGNGYINTTFGAAVEVGIPTNSQVSKNTEVVPKIFNDLSFGTHFTMQSILGYSTLYGGGTDGGLQTFEYGFVFGYTIPHAELPLPGIQQLIPVFELQGDTTLNKDSAGANSLIGNLAFRANFNTIGGIQPRIGLGYVFPIDKGASQEVRTGIITSFVFEF